MTKQQKKTFLKEALKAVAFVHCLSRAGKKFQIQNIETWFNN